MKKCRIVRLMFLMFFLLITVLNTSVTYGAVKQKESTRTYLFAVPEGGWSSCKVHIIFHEYYSYNSSTKKNRYNHRTKYYTGKCEGATSIPSLRVGRVEIKNTSNTKTTINSWTSEAAVFPGGMDYAGYYANYESVPLITNTSYKSYLYYTVRCSGATVPSTGDNLKINLATSD